VNGISACKRLETCRLVANFALSLPLSCVTTTHPGLQSYGIITRPSYVMICTIGLSFSTTLTPLRTRSMTMASISLTAILSKMGKRLQNFLPSPSPASLADPWQPLLQNELDYDIFDLTLDVEECCTSFNVEQRLAFDAVHGSVAGNQGRTFFPSQCWSGGKTMSAIPLLQQCVQEARVCSAPTIQEKEAMPEDANKRATLS